MTNDELTEKVKQLRSTLNARNGNSPSIPGGTGENFGGDASDSVTEKRRVVKGSGRRTTKSTVGAITSSGNARPFDDGNRSNQAILTGERSTVDRHGTNIGNVSSPRSNDTNTITRGRLVRDDSIPNRKEESSYTQYAIPTLTTTHRKPGRPPKQEKVETDRVAATSIVENLRKQSVAQEPAFKKIRLEKFNITKSWFNEATTIGDKEAEELEPKLGKTLVDYGGYFDQYMQYRSNNPNAIFFSDLSYDEGMVLARIILRLGKKDNKVATGIRTMVDGNDYLNAIIILWPRIAKVVEALRPEPTVQKVTKEAKAATSLFRKVEPIKQP